MNRKEFFKECLLVGFKWIENYPFIENLASVGEDKERPPGALEDDSEFLATCTGCDACMIACPVNVIMVEDLEKRYPVIYPKKDPCIQCEGLPCITACQFGALMAPVSSKENREHLESSAFQSIT